MIFGAKWSWESACFVSVVSGQLRWVESSENFQSSKNSCFFFVQTPKTEANVLVDLWWLYLKNHLECIEIMNIRPSYSLSLFCILLKLYTTKFQSKRSSLRCDPLEQENLAQKPGMKMLTSGSHRKLLRSLWNLVVYNLRSIQNSYRRSDGRIFIISIHSKWFFKHSHQG